MKPGDVYWAASDVGWVVGHSYIVYAPLLTGCTTVLYEGKPVGTPDAGRFLEGHFPARRQGHSLPRRPHSGPSRKRIPRENSSRSTTFRNSSTSSLPARRLDPDTYHWARKLLTEARHRPLVADRDRLADHGQLHGNRVFPDQTGFVDQAGPGIQCADPGQRAASRPRAEREASSTIKLPLPPGTLPDPLEGRRSFPRVLPQGVPRILLYRATAATSMRTAMSTSWAASTT